jgi:hypothetical protein
MGSERDVGYPYPDFVDARSDRNVLDRGRSDMFLYYNNMERIVGWLKETLNIAYRQ